ncbi:outer membrane protein assembly factor BamB family protein [Streptomyces xanthii]|uniref:PQQ-binding-like beta-propeller repeat protein n=1 Tax=Streptomyces xanthii TaxID=2768069 RepID=A0A7H1B4V5_9ACTN|nr:PQQ-binding-like beta-propeller repeat protein [Streptomyces xanthii]QNS03760.1 PQQ-binding-like beta-propeller repeat protein [Streptomyces xanthii]
MTFGPPPSPFTQSRQAADARAKRKALYLGGSAVVLALVLGLVAWVVWPSSEKAAPKVASQGGGSGAPDDLRETVEKLPKQGGAGHVEGAVVEQELAPGKTLIAPGMWATDKILAKGKASSLVAVNIDDGSNAWTTQLKGDICAVSPDMTNDGRAAIAFTDPAGDHQCNQVMMFRVATGEKLWQVKIPVTQGVFEEATTMTMTRGVVVTSWSRGSAGLDMANGQTLWKRERTEKCKDGGFSGGRALLLRQDCFEKKERQDHFLVHKLDPRTGKIKWTYRVAPGVKFAYFLSSDPAVVAVEAGDFAVTNLLSLSDQGSLLTNIRMEGNHYKVECNPDRVDRCDGAVVSKSQVFVTSGEASEQLGNTTNWVVAFDLKTGRSGVKFDAGPDQQISPIRMSGNRLLAMKFGTDTFAPNSLISLDPKTGKQSPYFYFTIPAEVKGDGAEVAVQDGRLIIGHQEFKGTGKRSLPDAQWLAYAVSAAD